MHSQYISYLLVAGCSATVSITLFFYAWKKRYERGGKPLLLTLALVIVWIVAQMLEMTAVGLSTKIIWANVQYLPIMFAPVTYLILTLHYTGHEQLLQRRWLLIGVVIVPIIVNILMWTNEWHGLMRQDVHLYTGGPFPVVGKTSGSLYQAFAAYNISVASLTLLILACKLRQKTALYYKQAVLLFIGLLLPIISTALHLSGHNPFVFDLTPSVFGLSGLVISFGILRFHLFNVVPIARSIVIEEMKTGIIVLNMEGRILDMNPAALDMFGLDPQNAIGFLAEEVLDNYPELLYLYKEKKAAVSDVVICNKDSSAYYEISVTQVHNSCQRPIGWIIMANNITLRKAAEESIKYVAFHDYLTGLPNRNYFEKLFSQELVRARRRNEMLGIAYVDIDNFKQVNDTYGHDMGDLFLCEVTQRLKGALRESDIISRLGGDEFVLLLTDIKDKEDISTVIKRIFQGFEQTVDIDGKTSEIKASIGLSIFPKDGEDMDVLLKKADAAMYYVKYNKNKNSYHIYGGDQL